MRKQILCDSSSLISLTDACLIDIFYSFHDKFNVDFIIPPSVVDEIVNRPLSIKMKAYQYSAYVMKKAIDDGTFLEVKAKTMEDAKYIMDVANTIFFVKGKPIHLVDLGEAEMIALADRLNITTLLMDERTTRLLIEAPMMIKDHLERELKVNVMINSRNLERFKDITKDMFTIRSSELISVAYEIGWFDKFGDEKLNVFEAALYKIKYSGCSVRFDEIEKVVDYERHNVRH